jgi:hypothetical protein
MPGRSTIILLLLFSSSLAASAQVMDTLRAAIHKKARFTFKLDTRNSFMADRRAEVTGVKLGVEFGNKLKVGGGYHWLTSAVYRNQFETNPSGLTDTIRSTLQLRYFAYYVEYVFHKTKRWEFSIPFQLGVGDSRYLYNYAGVQRTANRSTAFIYEPAVSMNYKIFKWLGAGTDIGVRVMMVDRKAIGHNFNSPTYAFKLLIWYGELYKAVFPNTWLAEKIGDDGEEW